jgi:hypothetical protein
MNYERNKQTGSIRRSDGIEKFGFDQVKFHRCEWVEKRNKKTDKINHYKMKLPENLFGIRKGAMIQYSDRYIKVRGDVK